jgi:ribosomal protein S18 acetylase RimI-like enzyme
MTGYGVGMSETTPAVEVLSSVTEADAADVARLLAQLSKTATFDRSRLEAIVTHDATELLVVRDDGRIVGAATLVTFPLPTGLRGHVDDVVVDEAMRGKGIARTLLMRMTELATERGLRTLDLTSRPSRESALRLYESVGFVRRETNVLRFTPSVAAV